MPNRSPSLPPRPARTRRRRFRQLDREPFRPHPLSHLLRRLYGEALGRAAQPTLRRLGRAAHQPHRHPRRRAPPAAWRRQQSAHLRAELPLSPPRLRGHLRSPRRPLHAGRRHDPLGHIGDRIRARRRRARDFRRNRQRFHRLRRGGVHLAAARRGMHDRRIVWAPFPRLAVSQPADGDGGRIAVDVAISLRFPAIPATASGA